MNEELLTHLFMAYVRLGDYKRQQQTALALYKLKSKNPYYFWAVMSVVMQAVSADDKLAKQVILPLAERMVSRSTFQKLSPRREIQFEQLLKRYEAEVRNVVIQQKIFLFIDDLINFQNNPNFLSRCTF